MLRRGLIGQWVSWLIVMFALLAAAAPARANGVPVDIYLTYLPRTSNWGPQTAQGKAHVEVADGHISVDVQGLPRLEQERYRIWLESRDERKLYAVGEFNVDASGVGHFAADLDVPNQEYRMLFLSVESDLLGRTPNERVSLAGMFPNKTVTPAPAPYLASEGSATPGPLAPGAGATTAGSAMNGTAVPGQPEGERPQFLPVTGGSVTAGGAEVGGKPGSVAAKTAGRIAAVLSTFGVVAASDFFVRLLRRRTHTAPGRGQS